MRNGRGDKQVCRVRAIECVEGPIWHNSEADCDMRKITSKVQFSTSSPTDKYAHYLVY